MHPALRLLQILPYLRFLSLLLGGVIVKLEVIFVCLLTRIVVRDRIDNIVNDLQLATRLAPRHTWMTLQYVTTAHTRSMLVGIIDQTMHSLFFLYGRAVQLDHHQAVERLDVHTVSRLALDVVHAAKTTLTTNTAELEDEHGADKVAQTTTQWGSVIVRRRVGNVVLEDLLVELCHRRGLFRLLDWPCAVRGELVPDFEEVAF